MFKRTRRTLAGLTAVAAIAGGIGTGAATAEAATCAQWGIPAYFVIHHGNGWEVETTGAYGSANPYAWWVHGQWGGRLSMTGQMRLLRFDTSGRNAQVEFTLTWNNGSAGTYRGIIDDYGYLSGTSTDRWTGAQTTWHLEDTIRCYRYYQAYIPHLGRSTP
jgi:hypothetical protein